MFATYPPPHAGDVLVPLPPQIKNMHPSRRQPAALRNNLVAAHRIDLESASAADHHCATKIAATWRGYIQRKRLATKSITRAYQDVKAVKIQCFIRSAFARRAAQYLREQREELCRGRNVALIAQRVEEIKSAVKWQAALFESSALKIQTAFRWKYAKRRKSVYITVSGEAQIIEEDVTPIIPKRQYLPQYWRRRSTMNHQKALDISENPSPRNHRGSEQQVLPMIGSADNSTPLMEKMMLSPAPPRNGRDFVGADNNPRGLPCLVASPASLVPGQMVPYDQQQITGRELAVLSPQPPAHKRFGGPPPQSAVEAINQRNRQRDQELAELLETEPQQVRIRSRVDGIVQQDLDHCAGVLQRRFRVGIAKQNLHSRQCLTEYQYRYAVIIQCAFRSFISRLHASRHRADIENDIYLASQKYGMTQVERLKQEFVWNANIMTRAARTIQSGFRRYRYLMQYNPDQGAYEDYIRRGPPSLPLGLMAEVPEHRTAPQVVSHQDDVAVHKYVFRRHCGPAARKAIADERARVAAQQQLLEAAAQPEPEGVVEPTTPTDHAASAIVTGIITSPPVAVLPDDAEARYPDMDDDELQGKHNADVQQPDSKAIAALKIQSTYRQHSARAVVAQRKHDRDAAFSILLEEEAARAIQNAQRRVSGEAGDTPEDTAVDGVVPPPAIHATANEDIIAAADDVTASEVPAPAASADEGANAPTEGNVLQPTPAADQHDSSPPLAADGAPSDASPLTGNDAPDEGVALNSLNAPAE